MRLGTLIADDWWIPDIEDKQFLIKAINITNKIRNLSDEHKIMALLPSR